MRNAVRSVLTRLVAYLSIAVAAGLLFLAGSNRLRVDVAEARGTHLANE
jgi:hypothetical protein